MVGVDAEGISLTTADEVILDVCFDGRRIWSFWLLRDSVASAGGRRIDWPAAMHRFLDGVARVSVSEHLTGRILFEEDRSFGESSEPIAFLNAQGKPLGIDKSGRMAQTFDTRSEEHVAPLLDSIETVLAALTDAGVEAFPAYGTLLGAVREGRLIGHDSDADLAYVSRHQHPYDVIRESFGLQRRLAEQGYTITRYSGAAFKVDVIEGDGSVRGLDVFGGYICGGVLYLMGEVGEQFERDWIFPLGSTTLEGRVLPAPRRPERLLAAMYGPGWKVPDPAFHFETSWSTVRRLNGWFRGTRVFRDEWDRRYSSKRDRLPRDAPSPLAAYVAEREGVPARLVDLGAGRGGDALWFARRGSSVVAYDYLPSASRAVQAQVRAQPQDQPQSQSGELDLQVRPCNLLELRSTFAAGAALAREPGPAVLMGNHILDATTRIGREGLYRVAAMALREGGRIYLDFYLADGENRPLQLGVGIESVQRRLRYHGATIVQADEHDAPGDPGRRIGRVVAQWQK